VVNGHIIAVKNGLHGVIDTENKVIIPFKYSKLWKLKDDDYFCVRKGEKIGVMEYSGKIKLPIEYDELYLSETLSDGATMVKR
jgi:hypothetical protein